MSHFSMDRVAHSAFCLRRFNSLRFHSVIARMYARWWGIQIGTNCTFGGLPKFYRHPGSHIEIGGSSRFNSSSIFNFAGIDRPCQISTLNENAKIRIGSHCGFSGTVIAAAKSVTLGQRVRCGVNTTIMDTDWHPEDSRAGENASVTIEDDVWLGMNVVVMKGVTIGRGTMVGANSLVVKSLPENSVAAGVPAKVIRSLESSEIQVCQPSC